MCMEYVCTWMVYKQQVASIVLCNEATSPRPSFPSSQLLSWGSHGIWTFVSYKTQQSTISRLVYDQVVGNGIHMLGVVRTWNHGNNHPFRRLKIITPALLASRWLTSCATQESDDNSSSSRTKAQFFTMVAIVVPVPTGTNVVVWFKAFFMWRKSVSVGQ